MRARNGDAPKGKKGATGKQPTEPTVLTLPSIPLPPLKKAEENLQRFFRGTSDLDPSSEFQEAMLDEVERVLDNDRMQALEAVLTMAIYEAEHIGDIRDHMLILHPMHMLVEKLRDLQQSLLYETVRRLHEEPMDLQDYAKNHVAVGDIVNYLTRSHRPDKSRILQQDLMIHDLMTLDDKLVHSLCYARELVQFHMPEFYVCGVNHRMHCEITNELIELLRCYRAARLREALAGRFAKGKAANT